MTSASSSATPAPPGCLECLDEELAARREALRNLAASAVGGCGHDPPGGGLDHGQVPLAVGEEVGGDHRGPRCVQAACDDRAVGTLTLDAAPLGHPTRGDPLGQARVRGSGHAERTQQCAQHDETET